MSTEVAITMQPRDSGGRGARSGRDAGEYRRGRGGPHPVDVHVGSRLRLRRMTLGMSQAALGERVGLTFQQIQKYERGVNRIGASRLYEFSEILGVPVSHFFDDMAGCAGGEAAGRVREPSTAEEARALSAYLAIEDPCVRKSVFDLMRSLRPSRGPARKR